MELVQGVSEYHRSMSLRTLGSTPGAIITVSIVAIGWALSTPDRAPAANRSTADRTDRNAQDEPPPIATCVPPMPGGTPTPPGLYPELDIKTVAFTFTEYNGVCVGEGWRDALQVCVSNYGPAYVPPFTVRVQGCVETRFDIEFAEMEDFADSCVTVLASPVHDSTVPCEVMVDAECVVSEINEEGNLWIGIVPRLDPPPMCTPGSSVTPTPIVTNTPSTTPSPSLTPTLEPSPIFMPLVLANIELE